jgi:hypothetical protein
VIQPMPSGDYANWSQNWSVLTRAPRRAWPTPAFFTLAKDSYSVWILTHTTCSPITGDSDDNCSRFTNVQAVALLVCERSIDLAAGPPLRDRWYLDARSASDPPTDRWYTDRAHPGR